MFLCHQNFPLLILLPAVVYCSHDVTWCVSRVVLSRVVLSRGVLSRVVLSRVVLSRVVLSRVVL